MKNWMEEMAGKYPLDEDQLEQKAALEGGDDMPFFTYNGERHYYDNSQEYVSAMNQLEDEDYLSWDAIKNAEGDTDGDPDGEYEAWLSLQETEAMIKAGLKPWFFPPEDYDGE